METIKFSKSFFWFKYWNFVALCPPTYKYPDNTCSLRKELILYTLLGIFLFPLSIIFYTLRIISTKVKNMTDNTSEIYIILSFFQIASLFIGATTTKEGIFIASYLFALLSLISGMLLIIVVALLISPLVIKISNYYDNKRFNAPKNPSIVKTLYLNLKDKVCSKIEYTD